MCAPLGALAAENYWEFSYKDVDVIESRGPDSAKSIAHNLLSLKSAIEAVMGTPSAGKQPPIEVYSLPTDVFQKIRGTKDNIVSQYSPTSSGDIVLIDNSGYGVDSLFNAYFGYAASVLVNEYSHGYPPWFVQGMAELFGASSISSSQVTVGVARTRRVQALFKHNLIPVKTLLTLSAQDPQMKSEDFFDLYSTESWLLVHQIIVEGKYRSNFNRYFAALDRGEGAEKAFSANFDVTTEELDKLLRVALQQGKVMLLKIDIKAEEDGQAKRLSADDTAGRLATLRERRASR